VLRGFEETDILPFGGIVGPLRTDAKAIVPLTFIPAFPIYPPETAWMRQPDTNMPGLVIKDRVAFAPADIDRRFARDPLPDYGDLLANLVRWAAGESIPLQVAGHGLFDCNLYTQPGRLIMHIANLTNAGRMPIDEVVPSGPIRMRVKLPRDVRSSQVKLLVAGKSMPVRRDHEWAEVPLRSIADHEVLVFE
jgi:hypothetical protein